MVDCEMLAIKIKDFTFHLTHSNELVKSYWTPWAMKYYATNITALVEVQTMFQSVFCEGLCLEPFQLKALRFHT